jgi:formylglycine-generating enzyme required for sulfatase activity/uncharacterized protein YjbI with pentapeptide repeats
MLRMFRKPFTFLCFVFLVSCSLFAAPPIINYAGQVRVAGQAFSGVGYLKFAFVNSAGNITYWSNDGTSTAGSEPSGSVDVQVRGGLYSILLGNTAIEGMGAIDPSIFQQYSDIHIRVWFNDGVRGFQHLRPDQPFSSVPYALSAASALIAPGSITLNMLGSDVQSSLGATIDRSRLSEDVKADLNRTIGEEQLSAQVTEKLNRDFTIQPDSINKSMLSDDILNDLNRTITLGDLDPQLVEDLNDSVEASSISYSHLTEQVRADLNRTVVLADLSPEVVAEINATIGLDRLSAEVTALLNRTINKSMLGSDVLGDLNATIDRSRLSEDVKADLNRTIGEEQLSAEVTEKLNRTITLGDLDPQVVADLNDSVSDGSITTNQLNEQILKYLRPEITQSPVLAKDRGQVYTGQTITLSSNAEGKFLSYQWLRNGEPVPGATNREFTITDANGSLHNGNYTLQVSNDFGMVSSEALQIDVNDTQLIHEIDLTSTVSLEMIWVEPGTFTMGQAGVHSPEHLVTLSTGYYLGKYEVTQAQYEAVMDGNPEDLNPDPSYWSNNPNRPVEQVSHDDIQIFLTRLNAQEAGNIPEGWAYVLPTEAQWEYACRAGTTTAYSWGDSITANDANWNHGNDANQTEDVGQYSANPWGFFDMHGNVKEWTFDWNEAYSSGAVTNPEGSATGSHRVFRGGSWANKGTILRSAYRSGSHPSNRNYGIGFRVGFQQIPADVASPEMQIFGDANITHLQDTPWVDPGVEAHDIRDGNLTSSVTVSGTVDVNTTGTYTLTYTVSDAAGNEASITRTVNVGIPANYATDLNASVNLEMIWVEPGTFTMGQDGVATPVHEVTLTNGFYLGKYEMTQAQYEAVMTGNSHGLSATPSYFAGNPNRPVEQVSYDDIQKFLTRLNAQEAGNIPAGWAYVLPTEAQWEYACRAGTTTAYSWGDTINSVNANYSIVGDFQTLDVGFFSANPWGFFDMHGNVWEWTSDWFAAYSSDAQTDPEGPARRSSRVHRGGSWGDTGTNLRSATRNPNNPGTRNDSIGFRVGFQQIPADVASPEMQIFGDANITHLQDTAWVDPGVEAHDVRDGNITDSITVSGTVDVNTTGTYTLTYTVSDGAGNEANITRTVNVEKNNDYRGVDISLMDFSGQDLSDALFDSTTIFSNGSSGVNFFGTGLKLDNLSGSIDLRGVNLDGVDLRGSDLSLALFDEHTVVTNANLAGTGALFLYFTVDISGANVAGLDFTQSEGLVMSYSTILTEYDDELGKYNGANISRNGGNGGYYNYSGRGEYENISGLPLDLRGVNVAGLDLSRMYREQIYSVYFDSDTIFSTDELGGASVGLVDEDGAGGWGGYSGISLPNLSGPIDLSGVNLSYVDLTGSDLSQAIINSSTCLIGANLYGTGLALPWDFDIHSGPLDIRRANVAGLHLSNSNDWSLSGPSLRSGPSLKVSSDTIFTVEESGGFNGANISGCSFSAESEGLPADLRGVNIVGVNLQPYGFSSETWPLFDSSTIFSDGGWNGATYLGAEESGYFNTYQNPVLLGLSGPVDLRGVNLRGVDLNGEEGFASGSGFGPSDLSEALFDPSVSLFIGANFSGTNASFPVGEYNFSNANITGIDLTGCTVYLSGGSVITGANFTNATVLEAEAYTGDLSNMDFSRVNLTGVNLSNLNLSNAVFDSNTVFSDTIYSESSTYFPDGFDPTQYPGLIAQ